MGGYLVNFSVYTFAMVGFLFITIMVYKKTSLQAKNNKNAGKMEIEDSLRLTPRKSLHVVNVNGEKFLIAADVERTEFLAKLDAKTTVLDVNSFSKFENKPQLISSKENVTPIRKVQEYENKTQGNVAYKTAIQCGTSRLSKVKNINMKKPPMMREILRKLDVQRG